MTLSDISKGRKYQILVYKTIFLDSCRILCFIFLLYSDLLLDYSVKNISMVSRDTNAKSNCCFNDTCELIRVELMVFLV